MEAVDGASDGCDVVAVEDECVVEVVGKVAVLEVLDLVQAQRHQAAECVQRRQLHTLYDTTRTGRRQTLITSCYGTVARSRIAAAIANKTGKINRSRTVLGMHRVLGPPKKCPFRASQSVQSFCRAHACDYAHADR